MKKKNAVLKKSIERNLEHSKKTIQTQLTIKRKKKLLRRKSLSAQHFEEHMKASKIKKRQDKRANKIASHIEKQQSKNFEKKIKNDLRLEAKKENLIRSKRLVEHRREVLLKEIEKKEELYRRAKNHQEELLKHLVKMDYQ